MTDEEMITCPEPGKQIQRLRAIMHRLRAPGGCPWDAEQTHESLVSNLIEETYETLMQAIQAQREATAAQWLAEHVPSKKNISALEARDVQSLRTLLQTAPALLSKDQTKKVDEAVAACEVRLDDLQVDGLLAKFEALSNSAKKEFMKTAEKMLT